VISIRTGGQRRKRAEYYIHLWLPGALRRNRLQCCILKIRGGQEDEYLRDGITEDVITELNKIRGLNTFSRLTVLAFRDKPVSATQIGSSLAQRMS
jgi:hypothetical protein